MTLSGLVLDFFGVLTDSDGAPDHAEPPLVTLVRSARATGLRTALLSNAEGRRADDGLGELFDTVVVSGEVGLSKPDPRIYRLTAERLGLATTECVFVDDLRSNVAGAVVAGMIGIHHQTVPATVAELNILFGREFPHRQPD
ncbi:MULTISPECIES: HAD-IA family hydrolase [Actinoalloteichus]|uniref:Haloacid dehalogenase superfamily enzyme, subfamily IA n=1 Tax=Actinoalloteichus fjordicus TaxID=1612552 RepID=A0AAC9LHA4_9PSEU|nr:MULTISPECIES: HAD-IA family hydrolase [Actinoalloteichus]APU17306.1 haloacid dehalogenase superfamily enzyme, subfamily IA [Actinoalloteichus fjordicus]APU23389.1 haloacid dehalogenase superfamily enzyme, subfamily IA [Actinoalloteichus sp. GBA129-24]